MAEEFVRWDDAVTVRIKKKTPAEELVSACRENIGVGGEGGDPVGAAPRSRGVWVGGQNGPVAFYCG